MPLISGQASQVLAPQRYTAVQEAATGGIPRQRQRDPSFADRCQPGINGTTSVGATYASTSSSTIVPTSSMAAAYTLEQQGRLQAAVAAAAGAASDYNFITRPCCSIRLLFGIQSTAVLGSFHYSSLVINLVSITNCMHHLYLQQLILFVLTYMVMVNTEELSLFLKQR